MVELPGPDLPVTDNTGAFCALGQSGAADGGVTQTDVFFLADDMATQAGGTATRACTIPPGRMLFVPMISWWGGDNSGVDAGLWTAMTDQQFQATCTVAAAIVNALSLEIDGRSYGSNVSDFAAYLTRWTVFAYTIPNTPSSLRVQVCSWDPTCSPAIAATITGFVPKSFGGGYWILLAPLPSGSHTIHFVASQLNSAYHFTSDVTYNLTVQ
jgi:hypothetical protein